MCGDYTFEDNVERKEKVRCLYQQSHNFSLPCELLTLLSFAFELISHLKFCQCLLTIKPHNNVTTSFNQPLQLWRSERCHCLRRVLYGPQFWKWSWSLAARVQKSSREDLCQATWTVTFTSPKWPWTDEHCTWHSVLRRRLEPFTRLGRIVEEPFYSSLYVFHVTSVLNSQVSITCSQSCKRSDTDACFASLATFLWIQATGYSSKVSRKD